MKNWRWVSFEPLDVLINADARGVADGFGRPGEISPAAFAGALRSAILGQADYRFHLPLDQQRGNAPRAAKAVGLTDDSFPFRFAGPGRQDRGGTPYFPVPRTHLQSRPGWLQGALVPTCREGYLADEGLEDLRILVSGTRALEPAEGWVSAQILARLLLQEAATLPKVETEWQALRAGPQRLVPETEWCSVETRHGHERDPDSGAVKEGQLFSRGAQRFVHQHEPVSPYLRGYAYGGLLAGVEEDLLPDGQLTVRLAGDGHLAAVTVHRADATQIKLKPFDDLKKAVKKALPHLRGLTLYLATPAIFQAGWRPPFGADLGLKLRAAAVGRPQIIAGWDLKAVPPGPKPVYRAIPAGSVYLYEVPQGCDTTALERLVDRYLCGESVSEVYPELGFGLAVLGVWNAAGMDVGTTSPAGQEGGSR